MISSDTIEQFRNEELRASEEYARRASEALSDGMYNVAVMFDELARDEARHVEVLINILNAAGLVSVGSRFPSTPTSMPPGDEVHVADWPRSDGGWNELGEDIKRIVGELTEDHSTANLHVGVILGLEQGDISESKIWLTNKGRQLGLL